LVERRNFVSGIFSFLHIEWHGIQWIRQKKNQLSVSKYGCLYTAKISAATVSMKYPEIVYFFKRNEFLTYNTTAKSKLNSALLIADINIHSPPDAIFVWKMQYNVVDMKSDPPKNFHFFCGITQNIKDCLPGREITFTNQFIRKWVL
jgi:hypothetical protein